MELLLVRNLIHDDYSTKEVLQYVLKCPVNLNLLDGELNTDDSMVDEVLWGSSWWRNSSHRISRRR